MPSQSAADPEAPEEQTSGHTRVSRSADQYSMDALDQGLAQPAIRVAGEGQIAVVLMTSSIKGPTAALPWMHKCTPAEDPIRAQQSFTRIQPAS